MAQLFFTPIFQAVDANGAPYSGALLYFYQTNTTTLLTVYQDDDFNTQHTNPVVADDKGQFAAIYLAETEYKIVLKTAAGATLRTVDPVLGALSASADQDTTRNHLQVGPYVASRTVLKALDTTLDVAAYLMETGREGWFTWKTGNYATLATADVSEFNYVKADAIATSSGAWVRTGFTPTQTLITVSGTTWTRPLGCVAIEIEACGGGGGSGGIDAILNRAGSSGGGASGYHGKTGLLNVTTVLSAVATIGAGGTAGPATGAGGGNGGDTSITIAGTTYTWGGGFGSPDFLSNLANTSIAPGGDHATGSNVAGFSQAGSMGVSSAGDAAATGGNGGSALWGSGGQGAHVAVASHGGGSAGTFAGGGGGGSANGGDATDTPGAVGAAGRMLITEHYRY
jgi:hypothetical protein